MMKLQLFASTDVGLERDHNEDNFIVCESLDEQSWQFSADKKIDTGTSGCILFVADGMGGTNAGEVASHIAQETVAQEFGIYQSGDERSEEETLKAVIMQAHLNIVQKQLASPETIGMGTTAIIAWIKSDVLHLAWSGDSRAYLIRKDAVPAPLTEDHSLVWQMVGVGKLTAEEARVHPQSNIITQSLGDAKNPPKPSYKAVLLQKDDTVILCSDGLNGMISDEELFEISSKKKHLADVVKDLIQAANAGGGHDNITVTAAKVVDGPLRATAGAVTSTIKKKNSLSPFYLIIPIVIIIALFMWLSGSNENREPESEELTPIEKPLIEDAQNNERMPGDAIGPDVIEEESSDNSVEEETIDNLPAENSRESLQQETTDTERQQFRKPGQEEVPQVQQEILPVSINEATSTSEERVKQLIAEGDSLCQAGDLDAAEARYREAQKMSPNVPEIQAAIRKVGMLRLNQKKEPKPRSQVKDSVTPNESPAKQEPSVSTPLDSLVNALGEVDQALREAGDDRRTIRDLERKRVDIQQEIEKERKKTNDN